MDQSKDDGDYENGRNLVVNEGRTSINETTSSNEAEKRQVLHDGRNVEVSISKDGLKKVLFSQDDPEVSECCKQKGGFGESKVKVVVRRFKEKVQSAKACRIHCS